jgi:4-hydroxythreonine-4-phosphate dehydrogenase
MAPDVAVAVVEPASASATFDTALPVVDIAVAVSAEPGHPDQSSAPAAIAAIRRAVADVGTGAASAIVTNPIAKNVLYRSGFAEPGHTEYLAKLAAEATGVAYHPVMMLWSPELAVVPVTIHLPLKDVISRLTGDRGRDRTHRRPRPARPLRIARRALSLPASTRMPGRTARAGDEDRPGTPRGRAAQSGRHRRARVRFPPTRCSTRRPRRATTRRWRYHDQALIPIKTLAFDHAVNVTLGLPFVRTSPDHAPPSYRRAWSCRPRKPDRSAAAGGEAFGPRRTSPGRGSRACAATAQELML